jgi:hypothetical protein
MLPARSSAAPPPAADPTRFLSKVSNNNHETFTALFLPRQIKLLPFGVAL